MPKIKLILVFILILLLLSSLDAYVSRPFNLNTGASSVSQSRLHGILGVSKQLAFRSNPSIIEPERSTNITELGDAVHAYPYSIDNQSTADSDGNYVGAFIFGFGFNPLYNNDPKFDYYIFDIYAYADAGSGWSLTTGGISGGGGPSLYLVSVNTSCFPENQTIIPYDLSPSGETQTYAGEPVNNSLTFSFDGFSFGITHSFYPGLTETDVYSQNTCNVSWQSGLNTGGTASYYQYDFEVALKVPKGQQPLLSGEIEGSFYQHCGFFCGNRYDYVATLFGTQFSMPPVTTITSNPAGSGFVAVDGISVATPVEYVWDIGSVHTLTASSFVEGAGLGLRYSFNNWNDSGEQSHIIQASWLSPSTLVASFQREVELNISQSSSVGGQSDPPAGSYWYNYSQIVSVTAIPNVGYALHNWVIDGVGAGNASQISVQMNNPHALTEVFVSVPTVTVSAEDGGTVTVQSNVIDGGLSQLVPSGGSVTYSVPQGSIITLTEHTTGSSYSFEQWSGSQSSTNDKLTITVHGNMLETANFVALKSTLLQNSSSSTTTPPAAPPPQTSSISKSPLQLVDSPMLVASLAVVFIVVVAVVSALFLRRRH